MALLPFIKKTFNFSSDMKLNIQSNRLISKLILGVSMLALFTVTSCKNKIADDGVPPAPIASFEMMPTERKGLYIALREGRSIMFIDKARYEGIPLNDIKITTPTLIVRNNTEKVGVAVTNQSLFYTEITTNKLVRLDIGGFRVNNPIQFINKSSMAGNNTSTLWSIESNTHAIYETQPSGIFSFDSAGTYTVRLVTSDKYGQAGKSTYNATLQIDSLMIQEIMNIPSRPRIIAVANGFMYVAGSSSPGRGIIYRGSADGGAITPFINFTMPITGLAVDATRNKLYWTVNTEQGVQLPAAGVYVADLANVGDVKLLVGGQDCDAVAVNSVNGDVYFGDFVTRTIKRVKSDGTGMQTIISSLPSVSILGLIADGETNRLYFSETGGSINIADISSSATLPTPFNRTTILARELNNPRGIFMTK